MEEKLKELYAEFAICEPSEVDLDATFKSSGIDSLDKEFIMFFIEEELDVDIPEDYTEYFTCLRDILNHLKTDEAI